MQLSDQEVYFLKANFATMKNDAICKALNISLSTLNIAKGRYNLQKCSRHNMLMSTSKPRTLEGEKLYQARLKMGISRYQLALNNGIGDTLLTRLERFGIKYDYDYETVERVYGVRL